MNPLLFFAAFFGVFSLLTMYISKRFVSKLEISTQNKKYFRLFLLINLLGIIFYALGRYYITIPSWLYFFFSIPIGILFLLFVTTIIYDIVNTFFSFAPVSSTKRDFLKKSLDISALFTATSLSAFSINEARNIKLERVDVTLKNLQKKYKIIQLSDIHIGGVIGVEYIQNIVKKVNELHPDIVVITGDLVDVDINTITKALEQLQNLNSQYGTYFIVGNHEYFHGIEKIITTIKQLGIKVLENENVYIGESGNGFNLAGVYDVIGYRINKYVPDLTKALMGIDKTSPTVLLAHQPKYIHEVANNVDLMLSGHTHGGQIYPFKHLVHMIQPYISGLHQHNADLQIYVNKGTGFWGPPMRLGASSEISEIIIRGKA